MEEHEEQTCEGLAVLVADTSDNLATKISSRARTEADRNRAFDLTQCVVADVTNAAAWLAPF